MAHILIIDDDPMICDVVSAHLENRGCTVSSAQSGQEGLRHAERINPDLIILDINMPIMDGTRVLQTLRAATQTAKTPVIALSAIDTPGMRDDMHNLGCDIYMVKPIDFDFLIRKIKVLLKL